MGKIIQFGQRDMVTLVIQYSPDTMTANLDVQAPAPVAALEIIATLNAVAQQVAAQAMAQQRMIVGARPADEGNGNEGRDGNDGDKTEG